MFALKLENKVTLNAVSLNETVHRHLNTNTMNLIENVLHQQEWHLH